MYPDVGLGLLFGAVLIWLGALSYFTWKNSNFLRKLFPKSKRGDIIDRLEEMIGLVDRSDHHIQRVALLRYNPYDDTGGNISFSLALLDDKGNGIVVTSLHSRAGTRLFAKPVIAGKSSKYQFSNEEEQVIKKALYEENSRRI